MDEKLKAANDRLKDAWEFGLASVGENPEFWDDLILVVRALEPAFHSAEQGRKVDELIAKHSGIESSDALEHASAFVARFKKAYKLLSDVVDTRYRDDDLQAEIYAFLIGEDE